MAGPPRPSSICPACWRGPFAAQLGLLGHPLEKNSQWSKGAWDTSWTGGYTYTITPAALLFRAAFGCKWCLLLVKDFRRKGASKLEENWWPTRRALCIRIGRTQAEWSVRIVVNNTRSIYELMHIGTDDVAARYIPRRPRLSDVRSQRTLFMAKVVIERCVREHERCKSSAVRRDHIHTSNLLPAPTRLIDCRDPRRPRVIVTKGTTRVYVALSYVWGGDQPHRTTSANLHSYMTDGIDPASLPLTIHDAIHVTHQLGINLLWTDSLCIIQDSPEDKHRELVSMCDVYHYAYLTIDAASAAKASDGFLEDRPPLHPDITLPFICPKDSANQLGTIMIHFRHGRSYEDVMTDNVHVSSSHTGQRAWCLQETLLSTRSLVFTPWTVQLRCQTTTQNIGGAAHHSAHDIPRLPDLVFYPDRRVERYSDEWVDVRQRWHTVVEDYSRRLLSYPSDKLVACAGLAHMFARGLGSDYVAGMWNDDFLIEDLLWSCEWPTRARPTTYLAPSWSWASLSDPEGSGVAYYPLTASNKTRPSRAVAAVVSCTATAQDDASPLVTEGQVVLRAHLFRCNLAASCESNVEVFLVRGSTQGVYRNTKYCATQSRLITVWISV
ncbi:HET-domain-containing protein [Cubamyces sp. BRFM 1775]|nr:HET-domain-containing protein [Cubamyces sp. BRFM 1775]